MRCRAVRSGVKLLERHSSGVVGFNTWRAFASSLPARRVCGLMISSGIFAPRARSHESSDLSAGLGVITRRV